MRAIKIIKQELSGGVHWGVLRFKASETLILFSIVQQR
jgi:hypothetical protein